MDGVLRTSNKGMFVFFVIASFYTLICLAVRSFSPYTGANFLLNTLPSLSASTVSNKQTFYGENIDMSQILPASKYYIINSKGKDLIDIAASLGINIIRITNGHRSFDNDLDSIYTRNQWNQVLGKMQRNGIKADIVIEVGSNDPNYYTPDIRPVYLKLVQEYIDSGVFSNPDVYAVDIKNEPILTDGNLAMLQTAHDMIKKAYPHLKQTIGAWGIPMAPQDPYRPGNYDWTNFPAGQKIANLVDFYSIHMYRLDNPNSPSTLNADLSAKQFLSRVVDGLQTRKPILIEEFGEPNGDAVSDQDTVGSPELQANIYQGVYQALKEIHSSQFLGSIAYDFYSRNQYPDAWSIVKNHGDYLYPAAYILQEYALGKTIPTLKNATVVSSRSYLVKISDNNTVENLRIHDRIGLELHLDNSQNYSVVLSGNGGLQSVEQFHYESVFDFSYLAVYQATMKGEVRINVTSIPVRRNGNAYHKQVYTVTVNIQ